jgi:hypothetical protein
MVARRVIPLVAAFVLAFAPTALEVCQASCVERTVAVATAASASHHHHHAESSPASPAATGDAHHHSAGTPAQGASDGITGESHVCENGDDLPVVSAALNTIVVGPAVQASTIEPPRMDARPLRRLDTKASLSERIVLATQLRV